jgi:hypothetical protein
VEAMKALYAKWLSEINLYPISEPNWRVVDISHREPHDMLDKMQKENNICEVVGDKSGIYVYKNEKGEIIYIGSGDPISRELIYHYREIIKISNSAKRTQKHHRFFNTFRGDLTVCFVEIGDDKCREIIEKMLVYIFSPILNEWIDEE